MNLRAHPHLYEINVWPWLERLSRAAGGRVTLGRVPDSEWDRLTALGFDIVYLMGVWQRSAEGRRIARSDTRLFNSYDAALAGWTLADVVGSPYSVSAYVPDARVGTIEELDEVRRRLHARNIALVLDFVPNHTGFDHAWVESHAHRYIAGSLEQFRAAPSEFRLVDSDDGARFIACGRDPYFPPWTDVAQLNYFEGDTRDAMIEQLQEIAGHCDGVRCDMAMLVLDDVFDRTWGRLAGSGNPPGEFWGEVRNALPELLLIAEVYWDLEWRLQELGFSFTYDKRLTDRLAHETAVSVRDHLRAAPGYQNRSARFLENHDEPRSFRTFGRERIEAAAIVCATVPGLRFYYDGQLEGRTRFSPVQLGRWENEAERPELTNFYSRLLHTANESVFHDGEWKLLEAAPAGDDTHNLIVSYRWRLGDDLRVVAANLGSAPAKANVLVADDVRDHPARTLLFEDAIRDGRYSWDRAALVDGGLFVRLPPGRAHLFRVR